jgi:hypothetical protein
MQIRLIARADELIEEAELTAAIGAHSGQSDRIRLCPLYVWKTILALKTIPGFMSFLPLLFSKANAG